MVFWEISSQTWIRSSLHSWMQQHLEMFCWARSVKCAGWSVPSMPSPCRTHIRSGIVIQQKERKAPCISVGSNNGSADLILVFTEWFWPGPSGHPKKSISRPSLTRCQASHVGGCYRQQMFSPAFLNLLPFVTKCLQHVGWCEPVISRHWATPWNGNSSAATLFFLLDPKRKWDLLDLLRVWTALSCVNVRNRLHLI